MASRAVSMGTTTSLGLLLSTSITLPSGLVNLLGTSDQAYCIRVSTDLSLSSLFCAEAGPHAAASANTAPMPALAPLPIIPQPLSVQPNCNVLVSFANGSPTLPSACASLNGNRGITKANSESFAYRAQGP